MGNWACLSLVWGQLNRSLMGLGFGFGFVTLGFRHCFVTGTLVGHHTITSRKSTNLITSITITGQSFALFRSRTSLGDFLFCLQSWLWALLRNLEKPCIRRGEFLDALQDFRVCCRERP